MLIDSRRCFPMSAYLGDLSYLHKNILQFLNVIVWGTSKLKRYDNRNRLS